ncbi:cytochrome P450 [Aspergillus aurantiobrunneus]
MAVTHIIVTLAVPLLTAIGYGLYSLFSHRRKINELRKQGIRMPKEWSWLTGHLLVLQKYVDWLPADSHVLLAVHELAKDYADTEVFLMDVWPVFPALYMVYDPDAAVQISTKHNLPKPDQALKFMHPITGGPSLLAVNDSEWKTWRSIFNPGFSAGNMTDQVPAVVDSVQVFCDILREKIGAGVFQLDHLTTRLTMDVILQVTLEMATNYQRSENELVHALNTITAWHSFWDPRMLTNPLRPIVQTYYGRVMDRCIRKELDKRFAEIRQDQRSPHSTSKRVKSVITLALEAYLADRHQKSSEANKLDNVFAKYVTHQIRLFLFAGNDTTSSSIVYVYHMLSKHPEALAKMRQEHDRVFGTDISAAAQLLKSNPALLNQCAYTLAVIKETLRLFPPASTTRQGRNGTTLTDRHGNVYPVDGYLGAEIIHPAIQKNPRLWPRADEFLPERWLVDAGHELYPNPAAWRPFEQGPRNCIGQTLVYNEMRIVFVMTARIFAIKPAYDEWDAMKLANEGLFSRIVKWSGLAGNQIKTVHGERAYQTEKAGTHPADGYPCRVALVRQGGD